MTHLEFDSRITLLTKALNDAHFSYAPQCTQTFTFVQPWHLRVVDGAVRVGKSIFRAEGMRFWRKEVGEVEGFRKSIQNFADRLSGFARSPESRFNAVLQTLHLIDGSFQTIPGKYYQTSFLGHDALPNRTYELVPPEGGPDVRLVVPWAALFLVGEENVRVESGGMYGEMFCGRATNRSALRRRGEERKLKRPASEFAVPSYYKPLPANLTVAITIPDIFASKSMITNTTITNTTIPRLDLDEPIIKDNAGSAFYVMDDGETGVWVFASVVPREESDEGIAEWVGVVTGGLRGLERRGVKRLLIDVSGNGGGNFCAGTAFAEYLISNTPMIIDQIRLTPTVRALLKIDFLSFNSPDPDVKPLNTSQTTYTQNRGGGNQTLSPFFTFCHSTGTERGLKGPGVPQLQKGWSPNDIAVVSDGGCGSACACFVRTLRDAHGIRAFVYGGSQTGKNYTPTSFEGGIVVPFSQIATYNASGLSERETSLLPVNFSMPVYGNIPVTQGYSRLGRLGTTFPAEWVPQPAEFLEISDPFDKIALWSVVVERMKGVGNSSGMGGAGGEKQAVPLDLPKNERNGGLEWGWRGWGGLIGVLMAGFSVAL
ncbi:hypothetical protein HDU67_010200 [Dinochytrium kinnereticum]|nr:hypothetical protein HDU67_010200 [Dinochytrium kinnereticum]